MDANDYMYKGLDLRIANQNDLASLLELSPVFVSAEPNSDERIVGLFSFSEIHNLKDLYKKLNIIYPSF